MLSWIFRRVSPSPAPAAFNSWYRGLVLLHLRPGQDLLGLCGLFQGLLQKLRLGKEPGRQNGQAHHFDEADVLLLDVVVLGVGVEQPQRVLLGGAVVAQHQVQLVVLPPPPGDGGDGVVGGVPGVGQDAGALVGVPPPALQDLVPQVDEGFPGPRSAAGARTWATSQCRPPPAQNRGRSRPPPTGALAMGNSNRPPWKWSWVRMDPSHNGQVRVGAHKVVGQEGDELQQPCYGLPADLHGPVLTGVTMQCSL